MSSCRAVLVLAATAMVAACGKSGSSPGAEREPPPAPPPPAAVDAPPAPAIDVPYELPPAHTIAPLPATPALYVFLRGDGTMRADAAPSFEAAAVVRYYEDLDKLGPRDPDAPPAPASDPGTIGLSAGPRASGQGMGTSGPGFGGSFPSLHFTGERVAPAHARVVVVADRRARNEAVARVVARFPGPVALAVRDPSGAVGALALPLGTGPSAAEASTYRISIDGARAMIMDVPAGTSREVAPDAGGGLDVARLRAEVAAIYASAAGAGATVALDVTSDGPVEPLVAALDAMAGGTAPVGVIARRASGGMRSGRITVPQLRFGNPNIIGTMDKNIIRRFLKRSQGRIKYCYEKQLLLKPGLAGTVTAEFVIGALGDVPSSKASGLDPVVARCIAEVIHGIEFPSAPGAGITKVSYPFTFTPGGG